VKRGPRKPLGFGKLRAIMQHRDEKECLGQKKRLPGRETRHGPRDHRTRRGSGDGGEAHTPQDRGKLVFLLCYDCCCRCCGELVDRARSEQKRRQGGIEGDTTAMENANAENENRMLVVQRRRRRVRKVPLGSKVEVSWWVASSMCRVKGERDGEGGPPVKDFSSRLLLVVHLVPR
jgi:hypothetical protein